MKQVEASRDFALDEKSQIQALDRTQPGWYRQSKLKLDELVTRRYALEQINKAVDDLEHGRILGRTIITYT